MKIFRDLEITGSPEVIQATIEKLKKVECAGWQYNEERGEHLALPSTGNLFCFDCIETDIHPEASLWIFKENQSKLAVSNIVPGEVGRLTYDEYNSILQEFYDEFVKGTVSSTGAKSIISDSNVTLEYWMSRESADKLNLFSTLANKSTGSACNAPLLASNF